MKNVFQEIIMYKNYSNSSLFQYTVSFKTTFSTMLHREDHHVYSGAM